MTEYFVPPPYYYKEFNTPTSFPIPNLENIKKHTDDYYSFGQFHEFKQFEVDQLQLLREKLIKCQISGNLKQKLKELSQEIIILCIKIQESIAQVNNQHSELVIKLQEKTETFNIICQYIHMKQKYLDLENTYQTELGQLNKINKEMQNKIEEFKNQLSDLNNDDLQQ